MKRAMFYLTNLTWGLLLNLAGCLAAAILVGNEHDDLHLYRGCVCIEVGEGWGGLNLGLFIFCQHGAPERLKNHEFGHAIQNCIFGPFMIPLVLKSACRYHLHNWKGRRGLPVPAYESWWFEAMATKIGTQQHL